MWCSGVDAERGWRVCSLCVDGWSALQQGADRRMRPGPVTTCVHTTTVHVQPQSMLEIDKVWLTVDCYNHNKNQ
jgi:hypothetical protein